MAAVIQDPAASAYLRSAEKARQAAESASAQASAMRAAASSPEPTPAPSTPVSH